MSFVGSLRETWKGRARATHCVIEGFWMVQIRERVAVSDIEYSGIDARKPPETKVMPRQDVDEGVAGEMQNIGDAVYR